MYFELWNQQDYFFLYHFPNDLKKRHGLMYDKLQRSTQWTNVLFITIVHLNFEPNSMYWLKESQRRNQPSEQKRRNMMKRRQPSL